nr:PREDICTED: protein Jade-2-like [Haliaeetus albicilla]
MSIHVKTGKVGRKEELNLAVCDCGPAFRLLFVRMPRCGGDKPAGVKKACYGILKVPIGSWLCRTCALGVQPKCLLCPKRGGALKPTRSGTKWVHVSCALWIPEVSIGCPEKMEPITKISHIPASRWALSCSLCKECTGTCIQVRNSALQKLRPPGLCL